MSENHPINATTSAIVFHGYTSSSKSIPTLANINPSMLYDEKLIWFKSCFRPHFDEMIFEPIDRLVHSQDALIGFIMMACVIDYLAGFWCGESREKMGVKSSYIGFIREYFNDKYNAEDLYYSLRNGLIHMFTIQNGKYALTHKNPELHLTTLNGQTLLNAGDFLEDLKVQRMVILMRCRTKVIY